MFEFLLREFLRFAVLVADGNFHGCTCRSSCGRGRRRGFQLCTASYEKHTSARGNRQSRREDGTQHMKHSGPLQKSAGKRAQALTGAAAGLYPAAMNSESV
jgi:hypothetical protein